MYRKAESSIGAPESLLAPPPPSFSPPPSSPPSTLLPPPRSHTEISAGRSFYTCFIQMHGYNAVCLFGEHKWIRCNSPKYYENL